jgi:DNA-binding NarL/FixJ family response regulator
MDEVVLPRITASGGEDPCATIGAFLCSIRWTPLTHCHEDVHGRTRLLEARIKAWLYRERREPEMDEQQRNRLVRLLAGPIASLSVRQIELLRGVAQCASRTEVARRLGVALSTVSEILAGALRRLTAASRKLARTHKARICREQSLVYRV